MSADPVTLPIRLRDEDRTATWNPAMTRAAHVSVVVRLENGTAEVRRTMNSGRVRVRSGERIECITVEGA